MSKKTYQDNFRVEVVPKTEYEMGRSEERMRECYKEICEDFLSDIKRHVDGAFTAIVKSDLIEECEFCEAKWTEGDSKHNGGCCEQDVAIMEAEK